MVTSIQRLRRVSTMFAAVLVAFTLVPLQGVGQPIDNQVYADPIGPEQSGAARVQAPVQFIPEVPDATGVLPPKSSLPETQGAPGNEADWNPGDPFDNWAWVKINNLKDVNTQLTEQPDKMPPNEYQVVNVSVVNKCPGPAPSCDLAMDIIKFAVINMTVWFPKDPVKPVNGEVRMWNKNGSTNANEWWGEIGGGGVDGKVWPLPKCARVYWTVKIWDVANRLISSSNSVAGGTPIVPWAPNGIQNYTVEGGCNWPPGALYQQYIGVDQAPFSAQDPGPTPPSETIPGPNLSVGTPVAVTVTSKKFIQMPWIILFVNQTTSAGDFNQSWLVGVRGYCYDFTVSPGVCDVSSDPGAGGARNGTKFVFDIPGFYPGTFIEYSVVAVDYTVWDYARDPEYAAGPWDYVVNRVFCAKKPNSCLASPDYYYHIPTKPPLSRTFAGRLAAQLLKEVYSPSGKRLGLDYIQGGCARFENDTSWSTQTFPTNEYGLVMSPIIQVNLTPPDFRPVEFRVIATWPCLSNQTVIESKLIPNVDGPDFTINATWIIIFANPKQVFHAETIVGWHGMDWAIVYAIGIIGFIAPTLFFGVRWFSRRKDAEEAKKAEAEARFKI